LAASGFLVLLASSEVWHVVTGFAAMGLGYGLTNAAVSAAVSLAVDEQVQGAAAGFVSASYAAGFIVGPLLGSVLYQIDPRLTFGTSAALAVVAFATALRATARDRPAQAGISP
jgi:MFS family permease